MHVCHHRRKSIVWSFMIEENIWGFKIGCLLDGMSFKECIRNLKKYGGVMVDLKICDTPSIVEKRVKMCKGADIITIMTIGGRNSLELGVRTAKEIGAEIAAVLIPGSLSRQECYCFFRRHPQDQAVLLAKLAEECGCSFVVVQMHQLKLIKNSTRQIKIIVSETQKTNDDAEADFLIVDKISRKDNA